MKLKFTHKLVLFIGSLLMIAIGVAILLGSLQFNAIPIRMEGEGFLTLTRFLLLLSGLIVVGFGVFCMSLPHRLKQSKVEFVTQKTDTGELKISTQATESIVQKCLSQQDAAKLQSFKVQTVRNGVEVDLLVALANNVNIPKAVSEIQRHIKKTLKDTLNIDTKEIKVTVEKADLTSSSSNYRIKEDRLELPLDPAKEASETTEQATNK